MRRAHIFHEEPIRYIAGAQKSMWTETVASVNRLLTKRPYLQLVVIWGERLRTGTLKMQHPGAPIVFPRESLVKMQVFSHPKRETKMC
jgi:hypothetical protein